MKYLRVMKINDIIRLLRKHIVLLLLIPVLLGAAVMLLTKNIYSSQTTLYTGMTSGTSVQLDQSFNLFTTNAAFDNLITVIQSRETSQTKQHGFTLKVTRFTLGKLIAPAFGRCRLLTWTRHWIGHARL